MSALAFRCLLYVFGRDVLISEVVAQELVDKLVATTDATQKDM